MASVVDVLESYGIKNAEAIVDGADFYNVPIHVTMAIVAKETTNGVMVYGHDAGGVFSTRDSAVSIPGEDLHPQGSNILVTPQNFAMFYDLVVNKGFKSNGVGTYQITYAGAKRADGTRDGGYFRIAREKGYDLATPEGNALLGNMILANHIKYAKSQGLVGNEVFQAAAVLFNKGDLKDWVDSSGVTRTWREWEYGKSFLLNLLTWVNRLDIQPVAKVFASATRNVYIRTGPAVSYKSVGILKKGTRIEVTTTIDQGYRQVVHQGSLYWVYNRYLRLV